MNFRILCTLGLLLILVLGYVFVSLIKYFVLAVLLGIAIWSFWFVVKSIMELING